MEFVASHFFPRRFRAAAWPRNLQQILAHFAPGGTIISRPLCQRGCELCHVWFKVVAPKTLMIVSENGRISYFQTNSSDQLCCQSLPPILSRIYLWLTVWYKDCLFCHVAHLVLSFWHEAHRNMHTWTMQASKRGIFTPTMGKATACLHFKDSIWRKRAKTVGHGVPLLGSKIWLDPWVPTTQATKGRRCWCFAHASRGGRVRHLLRDHEHVAQVDCWQPLAVIFSRCL